MRRILLLAALVVSLAACGGSSGGGGGGVATGPAADPVGAVNNFVNALKAKAVDKMGPLICAAKRDELMKTYSNTPPEMLDAMNFDFKDLKVEQSSINGDTAKVHVSGQLVLTVDQAKGKAGVRKMLEGQAPSGTTVTDEQVDQFLALFSTGKPTDLSSDVDVVKENGGWLMCSEFSTN